MSKCLSCSNCPKFTCFTRTKTKDIRNSIALLSSPTTVAGNLGSRGREVDSRLGHSYDSLDLFPTEAEPSESTVYISAAIDQNFQTRKCNFDPLILKMPILHYNCSLKLPLQRGIILPRSPIFFPEKDIIDTC
jgi:hypothetical protein